MKPVPPGIRHLAGQLVGAVNGAVWDRMGSLVPALKGLGSLGDKLHKLAGILGSETADDIYRGVLSSYSDIDGLLAVPIGKLAEPWRVGHSEHSLCDVQQMMANDLRSYLPSDILTKLDRAGMAVSLEGRAPFLDHHVVEFAWRLPLEMKFRNGQSKWVLKEVLYRYVDKALIDRPKMGFGVPLSDWLLGPLTEWAEQLLNEHRLRQEGHFNAAAVRKLWLEHLSGTKNRSTVLWNILMFQAWLEHQ